MLNLTLVQKHLSGFRNEHHKGSKYFGLQSCVSTFKKNKYNKGVTRTDNCLVTPHSTILSVVRMLQLRFISEVAEVIFSDYDSAPVPKFSNRGPDPGLAILKIWESDYCSDSGYNHHPTVIYPCFYLRHDHTDSCYCRNGKVTPDPGRFFTHFWLRVRIRKKNAESCRSRLR